MPKKEESSLQTNWREAIFAVEGTSELIIHRFGFPLDLVCYFENSKGVIKYA